MANMSGVSHNIAIESGEGGATAKGSCSAPAQFITKGSTSVSVKLKPGAYTFFCQAPGHRHSGHVRHADRQVEAREQRTREARDV